MVVTMFNPTCVSSIIIKAHTLKSIDTLLEPDWLRDFGVEKRQVEEEKKRQVIKERRAALRLRLHDARQKSHRLDAIVRALKEKEEGENERGKNKKKKMKEAQAQGKKEQKKKNEKREGEEDEDDDLIPADYESGKEDDSDDDRLWSNSDDDDDDENDEKAGAGKEIEEEGAGQDDEGDDLDRATTKVCIIPSCIVSFIFCSPCHSYHVYYHTRFYTAVVPTRKSRNL